MSLAIGALCFNVRWFSSGVFLSKFKVVLLAVLLLGIIHINPHIKNKFIMRLSHWICWKTYI